MNRSTIVLSSCLMAVFSSLANAAPLGTAFTHQGRLTKGGRPVDQPADMTFSLWTAPAPGGDKLGETQEFSADTVGPVNVVGGLFTVDLDFGVTPFDGEDVYLEIEVRVPAGEDPWERLAPRQRVAPTPYALQTRGLFVDDRLRVGIGTTSPTGASLRVEGIEGQLAVILAIAREGLQSAVYGETSVNEGYGVQGVAGAGPLSRAVWGRTFGDGYAGYFSGPEGSKNYFERSVGIGEDRPIALLHVQDKDVSLYAAGAVASNADVVIEDDDAVLGLYSNSGNDWASAIVLGQVTNSGGVLVDKWSIAKRTGGELRFLYGTTPGHASGTAVLRLTPNGTTKVKVLEILGADLAEKFPTSELGAIEPGTVMEIDPENTGRLRIARGAYNRRVAGVVSGAGGLPTGAILGNLPGQDDAPPIALSGRVWVQCDATERAIEPGDLLTTADLPGHAMKVEDHARATGATIGKAMSDLERGKRGLVLVLVSLQ